RKRIHQAKKNFLEKFKTVSNCHVKALTENVPERRDLSGWISLYFLSVFRYFMFHGSLIGSRSLACRPHLSYRMPFK
ncbi:MAG: hypothetical protein H9928_11420, partial [Candidatus Phocaeicola excrementipullorum]|nr:hypothetical protein [Candidatus Phocaeicola excrementipullorum]